MPQALGAPEEPIERASRLEVDILNSVVVVEGHTRQATVCVPRRRDATILRLEVNASLSGKEVYRIRRIVRGGPRIASTSAAVIPFRTRPTLSFVIRSRYGHSATMPATTAKTASPPTPITTYGSARQTPSADHSTPRRKQAGGGPPAGEAVGRVFGLWRRQHHTDPLPNNAQVSSTKVACLVLSVRPASR